MRLFDPLQPEQAINDRAQFRLPYHSHNSRKIVGGADCRSDDLNPLPDARRCVRTAVCAECRAVPLSLTCQFRRAHETLVPASLNALGALNTKHKQDRFYPPSATGELRPVLPSMRCPLAVSAASAHDSTTRHSSRFSPYTPGLDATVAVFAPPSGGCTCPFFTKPITTFSL